MVACGQATDEPSSPPVALDEGAESLVANPYPNLHDGTFTIHGLGNRCVDSGVQPQLATQVTLRKCHGGSTQNIRVRELDASSHDVALMVPGSPYCLGLAPPSNKNVGLMGAKLGLQKCDDTKAAQRFAFDGDAILAGNQKDGQRVSRELVIELEAGNTNVGTRFVAGARDVSDAEYFTMVPTDGSNRKPTSAFVEVATAKQLEVEMLISSWGSVIEVTQSMTLRPTIHELHAGATLRGARTFAEASPEIHYAYGESEATSPGDAAITVHGNTRVTDLALRGPTNDDDDDAPRISGVMASGVFEVIIDHLDLTNWTNSAVDVRGDFPVALHGCLFQGAHPRVPTVRALRNSIHNNVGGNGYGVGAYWGAFPLAAGNVMYYNRHSITGSAEGVNGYRAEDNFVLRLSRHGEKGPYSSNTDFDSHGFFPENGWLCVPHPLSPMPDPCEAGDEFDMGWNTFLSTQHHNFRQRGTPCFGSFFHHNVSVQSDDAVATHSNPSSTLHVAPDNQWCADDPTTVLGVGDFDGDGVDDPFVGTGVTWWYSPGGKGFWRLLNRMPEHANQLRFGDFDGDGRTDVLAVRKAGDWYVSWGGVSPWQYVNISGAPSVDVLAVGDFDNDGSDDVFWADGTGQWRFASAARTWVDYAPSPLPTSALRFGDFTGDGQTDVLFISAAGANLVRGPGLLPEAWGPKTLTTLANVFVADLDGDGTDDLLREDGWPNGTWKWSQSGLTLFGVRRTYSAALPVLPLAQLPIGRFDSGATDDVLVLFEPWADPDLNLPIDFHLAPGAHDLISLHSRQHMR